MQNIVLTKILKLNLHRYTLSKVKEKTFTHESFSIFLNISMP